MNWLLPEHIADALPSEAARIEGLRRTLLDLFRAIRINSATGKSQDTA